MQRPCKAFKAPSKAFSNIVDNKTVTNISNGVAQVTNEHYKAPFHRIRQRLYDLYRDSFGYKAGFLDPIDWSPREYNTAADHVANCVLAHSSDIDTLGDEVRQQICHSTVGIQIFCDGGYVGGRGASAFVVCIVKPREIARADSDDPCTLRQAGFETKLLGARGILIERATSSFQAEALALDAAVEWVAKLALRRNGCMA